MPICQNIGLADTVEEASEAELFHQVMLLQFWVLREQNALCTFVDSEESQECEHISLSPKIEAIKRGHRQLHKEVLYETVIFESPLLDLLNVLFVLISIDTVLSIQCDIVLSDFGWNLVIILIIGDTLSHDTFLVHIENFGRGSTLC